MLKLCFKYFVFILLHGIFLQVNGQMQKIDSLQKRLPNCTDKLDQFETSSALAVLLIENKTDQAEAIIRNCLHVADELNDKTKKALAYKILGSLREKQAKYDVALQLADSCKALLGNSLEDDKVRCQMEILLGIVNRRQSKYDVSIDHFLKAENIADKIKNDSLTYITYTNTGICYVSLKDYPRAIAYHQKAIVIAERMKNNRFISKSHINIGIIHREKEEFKEAIAENKKAIDFALLSQDSSTIAFAYNEMGTALDRDGQFETATPYLLKALGIRERNNETGEIAYTYFYLCSNARKKGQLKEGEAWARKALAHASAIGNTKQVVDAYNMLHYFFKDSKQPDSALVNYKIYRKLEDSLSGLKVKEKIEELNIQFETQKKDLAIKDGKLKNTWLVVGLLTSLLIAGIIYGTAKRKQLKQELALQELEIAEKEKANQAILAAEEAERKRISRDLHDNMGSYTTALLSNVEAFKSKTGETVDLQRMHSNAEGILNALRDTIWVLNNKAFTVNELNDGFKIYCRRVLRNFDNIHFECKEDIQNDFTIPSSKALHINKMMQEAIQNIIKYADAKKISYAISSQDALQISIADDGKGYEIAKVEKGNGLENMHWRANQAGCQLNISSKPNEGTQIDLTLPV
jgi:signal transduction histidine kinase